jgi:hypothetical protein
MDLKVLEVILAEEQARGLHPPNGRDLTVELKETRTCVDVINDERTTEAGRLS